MPWKRAFFIGCLPSSSVSTVKGCGSLPDEGTVSAMARDYQPDPAGEDSRV